MARNKARFAAANAVFLANQPLVDHQRIDSIAFWRGKRCRHIVFIEDFVPTWSMGARFGRSRDIIESLLAQGWWVTVWALNERVGLEPFAHGRYETIFDGDYPGGLATYAQTAGDTVDAVWLCRTHNFKRFGPIVEAWRSRQNNLRLLFDLDAVASIRSMLTEALAESEAVDAAGLYRSATAGARVAEELAGAQLADVIVAVNEQDRRLVAAVMDQPVQVLGHRFEIAPTTRPFEAREHLLFCGAVHGEESPNYQSLVWFCNKVLPLVRSTLPECRLKVVGYWKSGIGLPDVLTAEGPISTISFGRCTSINQNAKGTVGNQADFQT